jgi:hypothetical protein
MGYSSASDVASYTGNILAGQKTFTISTCPNLTQVNSWISSGCAVIESTLKDVGYGLPVPVSSEAYQWLKDLNALYAAARVEMYRTNLTLQPGERTRGQVFDEMFWDQLKKLKEIDLSLLGVSRASAGKLFVGGISVASKQTYEDDSDRVGPRFNRGMFDFEGTIQPGGSTDD